VLLTLLGAALVMVSDGDDDAPREAWRAPHTGTGVSVGDVEELGLWAHDSVVTRIASTAVGGFDADDGSPLWELDSPQGTVAACAASERPNARAIGAIVFSTAYAPEQRCTVVVIVDSHDGEVLWRRDMAETGDGTTGRESTVTEGRAPSRSPRSVPGASDSIASIC
jgi:outer membrane protein assembly factor BamB